MTEERPSNEITIRVKLPQPLGKVSALFAAVGEAWPEVLVDQTQGWTVDVPADE